MTQKPPTIQPAPGLLTASQRRYLAVKRALDILLAALGLVLSALPMAAAAGAVKLSGPGEPVLFRQTRVGRSGAPFTLYKFRSIARDGRVTPVGRFLRAFSLDELPQLAQVLTGTMSLIGPRPLIPEEEPIHSLRRAAGVYVLRPGLTGLAQISGRDRLDARRKAALDAEYLRRLSFSLDWHIFWVTIGKVLRREDVEDKPSGGAV